MIPLTDPHIQREKSLRQQTFVGVMDCYCLSKEGYPEGGKHGPVRGPGRQLRMRDAAEIVAEATSVPIGARGFEGLLARLLDRCRVCVLKDISSCRFDAHGVGNRQLIQYCGDCLEQSRSEQLLVLRR